MSNLNKYKVVLFDLDGTLLDTSEGIFNSVRFAEKSLGLNPIPYEKLSSFIGPPPMSSYMVNHGLSREKAVEATKLHRQYGFKYGVYEAKVYTGIPELLQKLNDNNIKLGVCTLKRQDVAEKILAYFNLIKFFNVIVGIDTQESLSKADTINTALKSLNHKNKKDVVLIGDSFYDAEGAAEANIDFIGVLYGFGLNKGQIYKYLTAFNVEELIKLLYDNYG